MLVSQDFLCLEKGVILIEYIVGLKRESLA